MTSGDAIKVDTRAATAPLPPLSLANRVCSLEGRDNPLRVYLELGAEAKAALLALLPHGFTFDGKRALDFGCGAGRTLRHFLDEASRAELWGADIDGPSIEWLQANLCPPLHAIQNGADPPLDFEDQQFDLAWALSVFTHLTDMSLAWLLELHRVLKPEGLLVATFMGRFNSEVFTHEAWDEDKVGMNILRPRQNWDIGGPVVLMSDWWIHAHWGRAFEILDLAPNIHGQTWVLMRKRNVELTLADLERPADDAREHMALRHNLRQLQRDYERALSEVRGEYEHSLSWRITRPLRAAARLARKAPR
jgi:SAM-dependent methyltransferase